MEGNVRRGKVFIETEKKVSGEVVFTDYEENPIGGMVFMKNMTEVYAKLGMTVSLGNYEFLRVDAGVTMPCDKKDIEATYEEAFSIAGKELFNRVAEAKKSLT